MKDERIKTGLSSIQFKLILIFIAVFGLVLIIGSIVNYVNNENFAKNAIETTAIVTRVHVYRSGDDTKTDVYVEFELNGNVYSGKLRYYPPGLSKGDYVSIIYDANNPQNFRFSNEASEHMMWIIIGAVMLSFSFTIWFIIPLISVKFKENYKKNKTRIYAKVVNIDFSNTKIDSHVSFGLSRKKSFIYSQFVTCEYQDEKTGDIYRFKSRHGYFDLPKFNGTQEYPRIAVYIGDKSLAKRSKAKNYYVDVDEWLKNLSSSHIENSNLSTWKH